MKPQRSINQELEEAREQLALLTTGAERNSEILKRSQERELTLLQAEDLPTLFNRLISGLSISYDLDAVTVVICDPDHDVRHLMLAGNAEAGTPDGLIFVDSLVGLAPQYVALRQPWLGSYSGSDHQLIFPGVDRLRSVALVPLQQKGKLFGSVNFGSRQSVRFTANHASDFLAHLGCIASFALENTVNRARLLRSGFTDVLTGWYNRRYLQQRLKEELARGRRHSTSLTCLMLDVDHFKNVNDEHGHATGDEVLREVAQQIETQIRATDVAARYGGEEFVILLPDTDAESGQLLADRIRVAIAASPFAVTSGAEIPVTVSIGLACASPQRFDEDFKTAGEALVARADVALYEAKSAGRNRVFVSKAE